MTAVKSLLFLVIIIGICGICIGEFYVANSPKGMEFISSDGSLLQRRDLSGIINFMMGLPSRYLHRTDSWPGLKSIDVFNPAKANLLITLHVPKGNEFSLKKYVAKYTTNGPESRVSPAYELNSALLKDYRNMELVQQFALPSQFQGPSLEDVDITIIRDRLDEEDSVLNGLPFKTEFVTPEKDVDIHFFGEIQLLQDAAQKLNVGKLDEKLSIHVLLTSLDILAQEYGETSPQVEEAIRLFQYYIPQLIDTANAEFKGELLCEVDITSSPPLASEYMIRHSRSLLQSDVQPDSVGSGTNFTQLNLAEPNSENFAVVFNIVLWLMIGFFAAVLAVAYSMWYMDPGKDNIIYRATSTRMKNE